MSVVDQPRPSTYAIEQENAQVYQEKHARFNYIVNFLDGSLFWLGYAFIAPAVILPLFVSHFTDSKVLIGAIAMIGASGWFLPQLFTSNWVQRMPVKKDAPVKIGFWSERVPLLLMPFSAMLALSMPALALGLFFCLFAWHAVGSGVVAVAWQDMIAKIIPIGRRGLFMGITTLGGNATGILGALLAAWLLDRYIFPTGYTITFAIGGLFIFLSWVFLALVREAPVHNPDPPISNKEFWQGLPAILQRDRNFNWYLVFQVISALGGMAYAFLAVYTHERWHLTDGQTGVFNTWLLVGQSVGNLLGGLIGDRVGNKRVSLLGMGLTVSALALTFVVQQPQWMALVFFLRGLALGVFWIGGLIILEFSTPKLRPTYIGVNNTLLGITSMVAPLMGGWIAQETGYSVLFGVAVGLGVLAFVVLAFLVHDPRHNSTRGEEIAGG